MFAISMRTMTRLATIFLPLALSSLVHGQSAENFTKLLNDLTNIDPRVRPVRNSSDTLHVVISFHLMSIIEFDMVKQKLTSNGWLHVSWWNEYLMWDPADYDGAELIYPDPAKIWRPRLTVRNTMKDLKPIGEDYIVIMTNSDGGSTWLPAERFETFCPVDVTYFPFDVQRCQWDIFIWGEDMSETDIHAMLPIIELDTYTNNAEWELMSSRVWKTVQVMSEGRFPFLHYEITLRRRPSLLILTVLLPVTLLAAINIFVFTIPSESGERLSYGITTLLSFGVFMSFILQIMPSSTETVALVAIHISSLLVCSALYVLLCILTLRMFHRDDHKHPVPKSLQTVIVWLEVLLCLGPPSRNKVHTIQVDESNDVNEKGKIMKAVLRKWRPEAYTDPAEMTWRRVSRSLDKLFFRFFFVLLFTSYAITLSITVSNYFNST